MNLDVSLRGASRATRRKRGFTLVQLILVIGVMAILATILISTFARGRAAARRAECDVHLKAIALALDTFRQDNKRMPKNLGELVSQQYVSAQLLRCPSDPDLASHSSDPNYFSYTDYYIIREPRDSGELPVIVCPFHEKDGSVGEQAYKGGYTKQFAAKPAMLTAENVSGAVTINRPGQGFLSLPKAGGPALELRGGDRIKTGAGTVKVHFADGSEASIAANTELTVLQSYVEGQQRGPLYTLVRQFSGKVDYYVNPGSHFDVATPTATAGALGTRFTIEIVNTSWATNDTKLTVTEHTVALTTLARTIQVKDTDPAVYANSPTNATKKRTPILRGLLGGILGLLGG